MDELSRQVTQAIYWAERFEKDNGRESEKARFAYARVSELEEQIAEAEDHTAVDRNVGRRGSIMAALKAGNHERAMMLLFKYEDNPEFDKSSNQKMRDLIANPEKVWADA